MPQIVIPAIRGMHRSLPVGMSIGEEGAYCRLMNNLRPDHGEVSRRPGLVALATPPTLPTVIGVTKTSFDVLGVYEIDVRPGINPRYLVVTEREAWLGQPTSWSKVNPVHSTGTVTVVNGNAGVAGVGTGWRTRGIKPGDYFIGPDAAIYEIASIASDTALTLAAVYQGGGVGGAAYTIQRNFGFNYALQWFPYIATLQGDLYIAGFVSGGPLSAGGQSNPDGGVLKINRGADPLKASWTPATDVSYVLSGRIAVESGVEFLDTNIEIYGFGKLSDGRLVILHHFYNLSTPTAGNRRVTYSSHLSTAVWTTSPGGATDIEDFDGSITGGVFYTSSVSIHLTDGIEIGELTGQDDPPLRLRPSKSMVGSLGPRLLAKFNGGPAIQGREVFIGGDLRPYAFNGLDSYPIDYGGAELEFVHELGAAGKGPDTRRVVAPGFCYVDTHRGEVAWAFYLTEGSEEKTREVRISYLDGSLWRAQYRGFVGHGYCPTLYDGTVAAPPFSPSPSLQSMILATRTDSSWWWRASEAATSDALAPTNGDMDGVYMVLDGIDGGEPWTTKATKEILVFFRDPRQVATGSAFTPTLTWRGETLTAGEVATLREAVNPDTVGPIDSHYYRPEFLAVFYTTQTKWRSMDLILSSPDGNTWPVTVTRIVIDYEVTGDARAD